MPNKYTTDSKNYPLFSPTSNPLQAVAKNIPSSCLLVTMDVKSLCTNIPNSEGISAVNAAFESYPKKSVALKVIITFLALIVNFMFNCKNY